LGYRLCLLEQRIHAEPVDLIRPSVLWWRLSGDVNQTALIGVTSEDSYLCASIVQNGWDGLVCHDRGNLHISEEPLGKSEHYRHCTLPHILNKRLSNSLAACRGLHEGGLQRGVETLA